MSSAQRWQSSAKWTLVAIVAVCVFGFAGFYYFFLAGDAPDRARLPDRGSDTSISAGSEVGSPDGDWVLTPGEGIFVGYRVQEQFAGETIEKTAVGRTIGVEGSMAITDDQVTAVEIEADLTRLESDQDRRDDYLRSGGLETDRFPTATFVLTEPVELPGDVPTGRSFEFLATGDLTLHGTTRQVELPLRAQWDGAVVDVAGGVTIALRDFGMEPPSTSIVTVDDEGELELQVSFRRAG